MPEELGHGRRRCPSVMVQIERNQAQPGKPLTEFFCGFFQQFSFADPTDPANTQNWLFGPYLVDPVNASQSLEEMVQKLPLMGSIGKEFEGGLSRSTPSDGFADWHKY